jgi:hypothetical protein
MFNLARFVWVLALAMTAPGCTRCASHLPRQQLLEALQAELSIGSSVVHARAALTGRGIWLRETDPLQCEEESTEGFIPRVLYAGGRCIQAWAQACGSALGYCDGVWISLAFSESEYLQERSFKPGMRLCPAKAEQSVAPDAPQSRRAGDR